MDWSKAKTILIIALMITDLILLMEFYTGRAKSTTEDNDLLLEILGAGNIQIISEIPKKPGKMAVLYVKPEIISAPDLEEKVKETLNLVNQECDSENLESMKLFSDELLEKASLMDEYTVFDNIKEQDSGFILTYRDVYKGIPVEESSIKLYISDNKLTKIERQWYKPVALHDKKGEIISPIKAVMQLLAGKKEEKELRIANIELVYWVNAIDIDALSPINDTALPAWKITDSAGNITYIEGY